jgi:hypothetical protein
MSNRAIYAFGTVAIFAAFLVFTPTGKDFAGEVIATVTLWRWTGII